MKCLECGGDVERKGMSDQCLKCGAKSQLLYDHEGDVNEFRNLTKAILELDQNIRWVGMLGTDGEIEASRMRADLVPLIYDDTTFSIRTSIVVGLGRYLGEAGFGPMHYTVIKYESVFLGILATPTREFLVTCQPDANPDQVFEKVRKYLENVT